MFYFIEAPSESPNRERTRLGQHCPVRGTGFRLPSDLEMWHSLSGKMTRNLLDKSWSHFRSLWFFTIILLRTELLDFQIQAQ